MNHAMSLTRFATIGALTAGLLAMPARARAQTDEIQVYTAGIADEGVVNLTVHDNFIASSAVPPEFPGAVVADRSFNGVAEWAYGVRPWFEAGLYLPLYSRDPDQGWGLNGFKLRTLFVEPHADDHVFAYGVNFEFSVNAKRWDSNRFSSEVRPILGLHLDPWDIIFNPIFDTEYDGLRNLTFAPALRVAYNFNDTWAGAVEEYDDFGPIHQFEPAGRQFHQIYGVIDRTGQSFDIEGGVGVGLTSATDDLTFKLILSHDFNKPRTTH
jgi:hypothetical protein